MYTVRLGNKVRRGLVASAVLAFMLIARAAEMPATAYNQHPTVWGQTRLSEPDNGNVLFRYGPDGTLVDAYATNSVPGRDYNLVIGKVLGMNPCGADTHIVNPRPNTSDSTGKLGTITGNIPSTTPQGWWSLCFEEVDGSTTTSGVPFTVI